MTTVSNGLADQVRSTRRTRSSKAWDGVLQIDDVEAYPLLRQLLGELPAGAKGAKPGRLAFFVQNGRLTACLSYPALVAVAFVALDGFQDALTRIETKLAEGSIEWQEDRPKAR